MRQNTILRPATADDRGFLQQVYASTRAEELARVAWDDAQKAAFIQMQFDAQYSYYAEHYPHAQFQVILAHGEPAGRLYLDRRPGEIRIVDITLLPAYRGQGIGTALLRDILAEGQRVQVPVTIHVERFNPALQLYERLGFRLVEDKGVYFFLEKPPGIS